MASPGRTCQRMRVEGIAHGVNVQHVQPPQKLHCIAALERWQSSRAQASHTHRFDVRLILGVHLVQHHDKSDAASECLAIDGTGHVLEGLKRKRTLCPCSIANHICRNKRPTPQETNGRGYAYIL